MTLGIYDYPSLDRVLDLMLTARLAEELTKPEEDRVSPHEPSAMFRWNWGTRTVGTSVRHWVRVTWHGHEFEETAHTKNQAARRLLLLHLDPEGEADEELAA